MGYLVDTLRKHGYVDLEKDAADGRAKRVILSEKGEAVIAMLRRFSRELEEELAECHGNQWVTDLKEKLIQLKAFLETSRA